MSYSLKRGVLAICGLLLCGTLPLFAEPATLTTLEGLVGQWVGLHSQIAAEQQAWTRQEQQWRQEIALLNEEERRLEENIRKAETFDAAKESRASDQLARKTALQSALAEVDQIVERTAAEFAELIPRIPPSLVSEDFSLACRELMQTGHPGSSARRVQLLVGALAELETLQNRSHAVRELIDPGTGGRREMDVVYLGLARGFAVSPDDTTAATGHPSQTEWQWSLAPAIANEVRQLVRIQNKEAPPTLVTLPLSVNGGEGHP